MRWNQQRSTRSPRFSHILVRFADNPAARQGPQCLALELFAIDWSRFLAGVVNSHLTGAMAAGSGVASHWKHGSNQRDAWRCSCFCGVNGPAAGAAGDRNLSLRWAGPKFC